MRGKTAFSGPIAHIFKIGSAGTDFVPEKFERLARPALVVALSLWLNYRGTASTLQPRCGVWRTCLVEGGRRRTRRADLSRRNLMKTEALAKADLPRRSRTQAGEMN